MYVTQLNRSFYSWWELCPTAADTWSDLFKYSFRSQSWKSINNQSRIKKEIINESVTFDYVFTWHVCEGEKEPKAALRNMKKEQNNSQSVSRSLSATRKQSITEQKLCDKAACVPLCLGMWKKREAEETFCAEEWIYVDIFQWNKISWVCKFHSYHVSTRPGECKSADLTFQCSCRAWVWHETWFYRVTETFWEEQQKTNSSRQPPVDGNTAACLLFHFSPRLPWPLVETAPRH